MKYSLYTDGGSRNNPGPAAIGGVLYDGQVEIDSFSRYIGRETNNVAEYQALLAGLELARSKKIETLHCYLDSELIVKQLKGEYKVKDKELAKLFAKVWGLKNLFASITFTHVVRERNKRADQLVNQALDSHDKS